jgi:ribosome-associated toxin RatA of RatAB toxin-antitoxin module
MSVNQYSFVTIWKIQATLEDVWNVIADAEHYPDWWKAVVRIEIVDRGDAQGVNFLADQTWKGVLPYRLSFRSRTTAVDYLKSIELEASGDLVGKGKWTFTSAEEIVTVQYNWDVATSQAVLNRLAFALKPILAWNHDEIMCWGALGLAERLNAKLIDP